MQLVYEASGQPVLVGDVVYVDNEMLYVWGITPPHKPASTGRVLCSTKADRAPTREWFPNVIGAKWIGRTDQGKYSEHIGADGKHYILYE